MCLPYCAEAACAEEGIEDADGRLRARLVRQLEVIRTASGALIGEREAVLPEDTDGEPCISHEDEITRDSAHPAAQRADAADEVPAPAHAPRRPAPGHPAQAAEP